MSVAYLIHDQSKIYYITLTIVGWLNVFSRNSQKIMILESLKYCQENKGLEIFAYCIMSNHIHLIVRANGKHSLSDIIRDFKKFTSTSIISFISEGRESRKETFLHKFKEEGQKQARSQKYKVWQRGYHAIELSSNKFLDQRIDYIHNNPVNEMLVSRPEDYLFSSARNYAGLDSFLNVIVTKGRWKTY
ncbi:MAG: transposase [Bacteroidota bacterium]|nr:transposase [Bacteroidota bacterium]